uniref:Palmitoyl-protein thioesterase 1 n=1 Tax=Corethrella appendiculata TaxID=1370023 RepID=U5ESW4_9DIPT
MKLNFLFFVIFANLLLIINGLESSSVLPIVLWHGMGDSCCFPFSLGSFTKFLQKQLGNVYVKSLKIGESLVTDYESGYLIHPNKQIKDVCNQIANDPNLVGGYNAIGFSQGGQFLRAVAMRCPQPRMINLVTLGAQHQGIFGLPKCPSLSSKTCEYFRELLNYAAYESWVQNYLVQATYWHNPLSEATYREKSTFIAEINNEIDTEKNQIYANNFNQLSKFIMVKFLNDTIVQPKESSWFGFYKPGQDIELAPMIETRAFERTGLANLYANGKVILLETEGDHLQFTKEWFIEKVLPYLK